MTLPRTYLSADYYRFHSPAAVWRALRDESFSRELTDAQVWDLVAYIWQSNTTRDALQEGEQLYAANCTACHGASGAGDGALAPYLDSQSQVADTKPPPLSAMRRLCSVPALGHCQLSLDVSISTGG